MVRFTPPIRRSIRSRRRAGVTLIELMIATAVMSVLVAGMGVMADAVYRGSEHSEGYGLAAQHARVISERIARRVTHATASSEFPGMIVLTETVDSWTFPDTLVVWSPETSALDPDGRPRVGELVVYCPNPTAPNQLLEITQRGNNALAPEFDDASEWRALVEELLASSASTRVTLTDLVRTAQARTASADTLRAALRFAQTLTPSQADWEGYQAGDLTWEDLSFAHGISSGSTGLRQSCVRWEIQLQPGTTIAANTPATMPALPFFGSAALYYQLSR